MGKRKVKITVELTETDDEQASVEVGVAGFEMPSEDEILEDLDGEEEEDGRADTA